ncbi:energy transducer TonB [Nibricoccus aquaticus]|nr:energy transducer TonB [Nibricoccus aquaticus]
MNVAETSLSAPQAGVRRKQSSRTTGAEARFFWAKIETESEVRGTWKYPEVKADKVGMWVALGIAVAAHAIFFFGFGKSKPVAAVVAPAEVTEVALFDVPVPEEELVASDSAASENTEASAGVDVPTLPDTPAMVNLGDFVQAVQLGNMLPRADLSGASLSQIPGNFRSGGAGGSGSGFGSVFALSDLDRAPTPTYRPLPTIPRHLLTAAAGVSVTVEFVVSAKGEVMNPRVISSDNQRFDDVALNAVKRWKFKPGFRQGRTVNVSMSQAIDFKVSGS